MLRFVGNRDELFYWALANVVIAVAVIAVFSYRNLYRRFYFLPPFLLLSFVMSVVQISRPSQGPLFRFNWISEIGLGTLAFASLLEQCWFQLKFREIRTALLCITIAAFCWWGEHSTRGMAVIFGLPRKMFWLLLVMRCFTLGLLGLFLVLTFNKRLPIRRPPYVSGVFISLGTQTCYLFIASVCRLIFGATVEASAYVLSSGFRFIAIGYLLIVFLKKEPPWQPMPRAAIDRMAKYLVLSADSLSRAADWVAKEFPESAERLRVVREFRASPEIESVPNQVDGRGPFSETDATDTRSE